MGQHGPVKPLLSSRECTNRFLQVCLQHDGGPATCAEGDGVRGGLERLLFTAGQARQAPGFERPSFPVLSVEVEAGFSRRQRLFDIAGLEEFTSANPVVRLGGVFAKGCLNFCQRLIGCTCSCPQA